MIKSFLKIVENSLEKILRGVLFCWSYRLTKQSPVWTFSCNYFKNFMPIIFPNTTFGWHLYLVLILTPGIVVIHNFQLGHLCRFDVRFIKVSYLERITSINQYRNDKQRKVCSCEDVNAYLEYQNPLKLVFNGYDLKQILGLNRLFCRNRITL